MMITCKECKHIFFKNKVDKCPICESEDLLVQESFEELIELTSEKHSNLDFMSKLYYEVENIVNMLEIKNRKYGNSALNPVRVFSKANAIEQLLVRIDDKISRLQNQQIDEDEDVIDDLIGYLFLLKIAQREGNAKH